MQNLETVTFKGKPPDREGGAGEADRAPSRPGSGLFLLRFQVARSCPRERIRMACPRAAPQGRAVFPLRVLCVLGGGHKTRGHRASQNGAVASERAPRRVAGVPRAQRGWQQGVARSLSFPGTTLRSSLLPLRYLHCIQAHQIPSWGMKPR